MPLELERRDGNVPLLKQERNESQSGQVVRNFRFLITESDVPDRTDPLETKVGERQLHLGGGRVGTDVLAGGAEGFGACSLLPFLLLVFLLAPRTLPLLVSRSRWRGLGQIRGVALTSRLSTAGLRGRSKANV